VLSQRQISHDVRGFSKRY